MKANTYASRDQAKDLENFVFLLEEMEGSRETFRDRNLEEGDIKNMINTAECEGRKLPRYVANFDKQTESL